MCIYRIQDVRFFYEVFVLLSVVISDHVASQLLLIQAVQTVLVIAQPLNVLEQVRLVVMPTMGTTRSTAYNRYASYCSLQQVSAVM